MVFSGIVETQGHIDSIASIDGDSGHGITLKISPLDIQFMNQDISIGCSIAVNGTCLTVTKFDSKSFEVDLAPETLRKTSFTSLESGSLVNLERALMMNDRNSGHTVQGHVDGIGKIVSITKDGSSLIVKISTAQISKCKRRRECLNSLIVPKGFIAVDGASLTICETHNKEEWFTLMLIPHTQEALKPWREGGLVNIEVDCLAKFVASAMKNLMEPRLKKLEKELSQIRIAGIMCLSTGIAAILYMQLRK